MKNKQIYPKGLPHQTEKFSDEQELKGWLFSTVIDSIDSITDKLFKEKGFSRSETYAGVYGDGTTYGHGVKNGKYNVKYSTKTKTYIDKITTLGTKRINSIINMDFDPESKILNLSYRTTEDAAFRGLQDDEDGFMNNLSITLSVSSKEEFKKILSKILKSAISKEVAFLTSTKLGIEDKVDKSTASTVESGNEKNQTKKTMKLSELFNEEPEGISSIFESKKNEFPSELKKKNTIELGDDKYLMFDGEEDEEEEDVFDEITSAGGGAGVSNLGTAGNFGYLAPAAFKKTKENEKFFETPYAKNKVKRPSINKTKSESDTFWTTVELNKGSGYVPKGMEKNYVSGAHSLNESEIKPIDLTKRKFSSINENEELGINKRYIITKKLSESEEKDKFRRFALFEEGSTIRMAESVIEECSCQDSNISMSDYEEEFNDEFESRNQDLEDGDELNGRKIIIVQKPESEISYKVYEDDFLNENRLYIHDFLTGNFVENPNHKKNSQANEKKYISETHKRIDRPYSTTSMADTKEDSKPKSKKQENKFPWQY